MGLKPEHEELISAALAKAVERGEKGVQVAAYLGSELIIDAWTGVADPTTGRPVDGDTLFPVFSVTKAVTAVALHIQAERGLVDYDAPVAQYWPEYGTKGKEKIKIKHVLSHRSGVPQMPPGVTPERTGDWQWMMRGLEDVTPYAAPDERSAYHTSTFGWILAEVVRRTDPKGRDFRTFVAEEIAEPLKIQDLWLGIRPEDNDRVATLDTNYTFLSQPSDIGRLAAPAGMGGPAFNRPEIRQICNPGGGGIFTARSEARFFALLANKGELDGVRLLSAERVMSFSTLRDRPDEMDEVLQFVPNIGIGGLRVGGPSPPAEPVIGENPHILCHSGAGGSIGWADPDIGLAVGICHNRMFSTADRNDPRTNPFYDLGEAIRTVANDLNAG